METTLHFIFLENLRPRFIRIKLKEFKDGFIFKRNSKYLNKLLVCLGQNLDFLNTEALYLYLHRRFLDVFLFINKNKIVVAACKKLS